MGKGRNKVVPLQPIDSADALLRLNRVTGLRFASWPESLLDQVRPVEESSGAESQSPQVRLGNA